MEKNDNERLKDEILAALNHPEADEGLYFRNFFHLHEEDERPAVVGESSAIREALKGLVKEGIVLTDNTGPEPIFILAKH